MIYKPSRSAHGHLEVVFQQLQLATNGPGDPVQSHVREYQPISMQSTYAVPGRLFPVTTRFLYSSDNVIEAGYCFDLCTNPFSAHISCD